MDQIQILTTTANIKDVCWLVTRHYRTPDQSVPAWVGFNQLTITNKQQVTSLSYLPIINASAHEYTHEEADTRIILHATAAYEAGFERVIIASRDSDVLGLVNHFSAQLSRKLWMKTGRAKQRRCIAVHDNSYILLSEGTSQHIMH